MFIATLIFLFSQAEAIAAVNIFQNGCEDTVRIANILEIG